MASLAPAAQHDPEIGPALPDVAALAMRAVHRAVGDLRRGTPVLLRGPEGCLAVAAAETVGARGLAELAAVAPAPAVLLLASARAAAVLHRPVPQHGTATEDGAVAIRLTPALLTPPSLLSLADPVAEQLLPEAPERVAAPPLAAAAIALAKLGRLLPALVAAPLPEAYADGHALLSVQAADVLAYPTTAATSLTRIASATVPLEDAHDVRLVSFR
ncbi:MAG: GTP cyclohydrolase II, partial [Acetobacteraceae bacterium]